MIVKTSNGGGKAVLMIPHATDIDHNRPQHPYNAERRSDVRRFRQAAHHKEQIVPDAAIAVTTLALLRQNRFCRRFIGRPG